jgi:hypothetical protein
LRVLNAKFKRTATAAPHGEPDAKKLKPGTPTSGTTQLSLLPTVAVNSVTTPLALSAAAVATAANTVCQSAAVPRVATAAAPAAAPAPAPAPATPAAPTPCFWFSRT